MEPSRSGMQKQWWKIIIKMAIPCRDWESLRRRKAPVRAMVFCVIGGLAPVDKI